MIHLHSEEVDVVLGGNVAPADRREVCHEDVGDVFGHETSEGLMEGEAIGFTRRHELAFSIAVHTHVCARGAHIGGNSYEACAAS